MEKFNLGSSFSANASEGEVIFRPGALLRDRYQLLAELKRSAAVTCFKAWDQNSGEKVFLQIFSEELSRSTQFVEELKEFCQTWALLTHPAIVQFRSLEREAESGLFFLVTEFVEGQNFRRWAKEKRSEASMTRELYLPVLRQMAALLDHLHANALVCQTLTPDNVLITPQNEVKFLDPGIMALCLKAFSGTNEAENLFFDRKSYMSPEQWRGKPPKAPSDQYALAVMVNEMLTGDLPFDSSDTAILRQAVLEETPEPVPQLSRGAQKALFTALSKEPARRFRNCTEFITALSGRGIRYLSWVLLLCFAIFAVVIAGGWFAFRNKFLITQFFTSEAEKLPQLTAPETARQELSDAAAVSKQQTEELKQLAAAKKRTEEKLRQLELQQQAAATRQKDLRTANVRVLSRLKEKMAKISRERPDRSQTFGLHLDTLAEHFSAAEKALQHQEWLTASQFLALAEKEADWIIINSSLRSEIREMLKKVAKRKAEADRYDSQKMAHVTYQKALSQEQAGLKYCANGEFVQAANVLQQAFENYYAAYSEAYNLTLENLKNSADFFAKNKNWKKVKEIARQMRKLDSTKADELDRFTVQQLRLEKIGNILARARQAKALQQWEKVKEHTLEVLALDDTNKEANALFDEAEYAEQPKFSLFGLVDGKGVPCAYRCLKGSPRGNVLKKGDSYSFELVFTDQEGSEYLGVITFVCDWEGMKEFNVPLERNFFKMLDIGNGVKLEMVKIYAGKFLREDGQTVTLTKNYYLGKFEVTQQQYKAVTGNDPSRFKRNDNPVEQITWDMAKDFCEKLNARYTDLLPPGYKFDLPTEAQWEYACRAGTSTVYSYGNASDGTKMNFNGNFPHGTHRKSFFRKAPLPVGVTGYKNAFGLYDMHGNVAEWCRDGYSGSYPPGTVDPFKSPTGSYRVYRGGSWFSNGKFCRSAERNGLNAGDTSDDLGFRLALVPEQ